MKCMECGAAMKVTRENHRYDEGGLPGVTLEGVEVRSCPKCGEREVVIPRLADLHRAIAFALATRPARLTGDEVRFLRKQLGFSGEGFAAAMGVQPSTVSRWERGREPMGGTAQRLLRLMTLRDRPADEYPNERLAEVRKEAARPARLTLRADRQGWHPGTVAA